MDMPFYETGTVKKKPLGEADVQADGRSAGKNSAASDLRGRRSLGSARHASRLPSAVLQACQRVQYELGLAAARSGSIAGRGRSGSRTKSRWPCR